jgi:Alw26I/Eco31I/Esp3I family type II restriction m6 adenine DNA methyltransferase
MKENYELFKKLKCNFTSKDILDYLISFLSDKVEVNTIDDISLKTIADNDPIKIIELIGIGIQNITELEQIFNTNKRKHHGIYFTDYVIAKKMSDDLIKDLSLDNINNYKFYEPCLGGGIFVISYVDAVVDKFGLEKIDLQEIVNNIYYSDIEALSVEIFNKIFPLYINKKYKVDIKLKTNNSYVGDVLFFKVNEKLTKNDPKIIFNIPEGFDIVLTNPPYRLLKANGDKYSIAGVNSFADDTKELIDYIKSKNIYKYNSGTLNLYKLFVEEIVENYTHDKSKIGLLIPNTLLNDKQSEELRIRILDNYKIEKIFLIKEKNDFFPDISQSLMFFNLHKDKKTSQIEILKDISKVDDLNMKGVTVKLETISMVSSSKPIIIEDKIGYEILNKLSKFPKLKTNPNILNLRGELDLTLNKKYITSKETRFKLVKGINVAEFSLKGDMEYVEDSFVTLIGNKGTHSKLQRLCCQQISNMGSKKRLKFALVEPNYILGNSCNYLALDSNNLFSDNSLSLQYLLGLLNSDLMDWRFRLTNSNNHVSNYEISELPLPIPDKYEINKITFLVEKLNHDNKDKGSRQELNNLIYSIFNLSDKEKEYISSKYI